MEQWLELLGFILLPFAYVALARQPLSFLGIRREGASRELRIGVAIGFLVGLASVGAVEVLDLFGISDLAPVEEFIRKQGLPRIAVLTLFVAVVEEIFFRGFLQGFLLTAFKSDGLGGHHHAAHSQKWIRWSPVVFPSAVLFGLAHAGYGSVTEVVATFLLGLILGFIYQARRNIACPIAIHMVFNWVNLGWYCIQESGPQWW